MTIRITYLTPSGRAEDTQVKFMSIGAAKALCESTCAIEWFKVCHMNRILGYTLLSGIFTYRIEWDSK